MTAPTRSLSTAVPFLLCALLVAGAAFATPGRAWRRLDGHPSTQPDPAFVPVVEGEVLMNRPNASAVPTPFRVAADGIALSADGSRVFYSPLSSRHLFSVSADALVDTELPDERVAATVIDYGEKGASDGLESDAEGRIYVTDYEHDGTATLCRRHQLRHWCTTRAHSGRTRDPWPLTAISTLRPTSCIDNPVSTAGGTYGKSHTCCSASKSMARPCSCAKEST